MKFQTKEIILQRERERVVSSHSKSKQLIFLTSFFVAVLFVSSLSFPYSAKAQERKEYSTTRHSIIASVSNFFKSLLFSPVKQKDDSQSAEVVPIKKSSFSQSSTFSSSVIPVNTGIQSSVSANLDSLSPRAGATPVDGLRGNDRAVTANSVASSVTKKEVLDLIKQSDDRNLALIRSVLTAPNPLSNTNSLSVQQSLANLSQRIFTIQENNIRQLDHTYNSISRSFDDITSLDGVTMTNSSFSGTTGTLTGLLIGAAGTFSGNLTVSGDGNFDSGTLYIDSVNNRVGVGTTTPNNSLQVAGLINFDNTQHATYLGYQAGNSVNTGTDNTFLGYWAGYSNTTGNYNNYIGYRAGYSNTTGGNNNCIGWGACYGVLAGSYFNDMLGMQAGYNATGAYNDIFIGYAAGYNAGSANGSIYIGRQTGYNNSGSQNLFMGRQAGYVTSTGGNNVFLGHNSGYNNIGSSNVFLGFQSGYNETGSNKLYIANSNTASPLIYGDFGTSILAINGNVGISTTSPGTILSVSGVGNFAGTGSTLYSTLTAPYFTATSTTATSTFAGGMNVAGSSGLTVLQNGNVGVGTTSPSQKLTVGGDTFLGGALIQTDETIFNKSLLLQTYDIFDNYLIGSYSASYSGSSYVLTFPAMDSSNFLVIHGKRMQLPTFQYTLSYNASNPYAQLFMQADGTVYANYSANGWTTGSNISNSLYLGVYTMDGSGVISFYWNASTARPVSISGSTISDNAGDQYISLANGNGNITYKAGTSYLGLGHIFLGQVSINANSDGGAWTTLIVTGTSGQTANLQEWKNSSGTILGSVAANGNVTIGTTSPWAKLSIQNTYGNQLPLFDIASSTSAAYATSSVFRVNADGSVGIATTSPWRTLSVAGTVGFNSSLGTGVGGNYLCIDTTTFEVLRGNGTACTASSIRFKENVNNLNYGLDEVLRLRPVSYNYKPESNMGIGSKLGFIAEEMQTILPEVVSLDKDGNVFGLDYPVLTSVLTKAIQELNLKVSDLEARAGSSTATQTGGGISISSAVSYLASFGATITEGLAQFKNVITEKLTVGSSQKPTGITIYDEDTGQPYCVKMKNGQIVNISGECVSGLASSSSLVYSSSSSSSFFSSLSSSTPESSSSSSNSSSVESSSSSSSEAFSSSSSSVSSEAISSSSSQPSL